MLALDPSAARGGKYSDATRIQALAVYAETGNAFLAADTVGTTPETVGQWVASPEAPKMLDDLRAGIRYRTGWRLAELSGLALDRLDTALREGDEVVLKSGEIVHKRQSARDAAIIASILIDKHALISGQLVQSNAAVEGINAVWGELKALNAAVRAGGTVSPGPEAPDPVPPFPEGPGGETLLG